jgi:hypothetical protein
MDGSTTTWALLQRSTWCLLMCARPEEGGALPLLPLYPLHFNLHNLLRPFYCLYLQLCVCPPALPLPSPPHLT